MVKKKDLSILFLMVLTVLGMDFANLSTLNVITLVFIVLTLVMVLLSWHIER